VHQTNTIIWIPATEKYPEPGVPVLVSTETRIHILQLHKGRPNFENDKKWMDWRGMGQLDIQFKEVIAWA
jgi:hypothetical protein